MTPSEPISTRSHTQTVLSLTYTFFFSVPLVLLAGGVRTENYSFFASIPEHYNVELGSRRTAKFIRYIRVFYCFVLLGPKILSDLCNHPIYPSSCTYEHEHSWDTLCSFTINRKTLLSTIGQNSSQFCSTE